MDKETISWIDATGIEHILTEQEDIDILIGPKGRFMPSIEISEEEVPFEHGSRPRNVKVKAREVDLPVEIYGITPLEIRQKLRKLTRIFNPLQGDGKLQSVGFDGTRRELVCRYIGGLEIEEQGRLQQKFVLVLKAFDPFWYDTITQVKTFTPGQPATFFPVFPMRLTSSSVFADDTVDNDGDVETPPEWIITGPGENITLRNLTTGEILHLENLSLQAGESVTINTKRKNKSVKKNDGTNLFHTLSDDSSLWSFREGQNNIRIEMSNSTSQSSVQLSYRNRYWGP
jgi:phage-related protein